MSLIAGLPPFCTTVPAHKRERVVAAAAPRELFQAKRRIGRLEADIERLECANEQLREDKAVLLRKIESLRQAAAPLCLEEDDGDMLVALLAPKERLVAFMAVTGTGYKKIAANLSTSEQVVKNYMRSVFRKTCKSSRLELMDYAHQSPRFMAALRRAAVAAS